MARPKTFEPDAALANIQSMFWTKGYEGTSMHDLEEATGLKKQSLYREFGDKRQMYLKALQLYNRINVPAVSDILLGSGSAADRYTRFFTAIIDEVVRTGNRKGCFLCNSSIDQAQLDQATLAVVETGIERTTKIFRKALASDQQYQHDMHKLRRTTAQLVTHYFGLRVLIKAGAPEEMLRDAVTAAVSII